MILSSEQNNAINAISNTNKNVILNAPAGWGKTTLITELSKQLNSKTMLYSCFNNNLSNEMKEKNIGGLNIKNFHSIGLSLIKDNLKTLGVKSSYNWSPNSDSLKNKYYKLIKSEVEKLKEPETYEINLKNIRLILEFIIKECLYGKDINISDILSVEDATEQQLHIATKILKEETIERKFLSKEKKEYTFFDNLDYLDFLLYPIKYNLFPKTVYDICFIDEYQDCNTIFFTLVEKVSKRQIYLGDEKQSINLWNNADITKIKTHLKDATILNYNGTNRYTQEIASFINREFNYNIETFSQEKGEVITTPLTQNDLPNVLNNEKLGETIVLAYKNSDIISIATELLNSNIKFKILGIDLEKEIENHITSIINYANKIQEKNNLPEITTMEDLLTFTNKKLTFIVICQKKNGISQEDTKKSSEYKEVLLLKRLIEVLISKGINTISEFNTYIAENIKTTNNTEKNENEKILLLSTIHKAKGTTKEITFVFNKESLLDVSKIEPQKQETESNQRKNMLYVAYSRTKKVLYPNCQTI